MDTIINIKSRQIFDSRGFPTVETDVYTKKGFIGRAAVPSGASTGKHEAFELRDNKINYSGKSVLKAVSNVNGEIFDCLTGMNVLNQSKIDESLIKLDGTKNKSRLGANAILSVSMACAKAASASLNMPLYKYLGGVKNYKMPTPMLNIINGGAHSNNNLSFQEFMIVPVNNSTFNEAIRKSSEVFHTLKSILESKNYSTSVGDEGGFSPDLKSEEEALILICDAIKESGYKLKKDFCIALDIAATELYKNNRYHLSSNKKSYKSLDFINFISTLTKKFPIVSIEDPCSEDDWKAWQTITTKLGKNIQIVGDDLFTTNLKRLQIGIKDRSANAILIKLNQIGTLSETIDCIHHAESNGLEVIISHRSGETEDVFISDLSVAFNSGQIKTGSMSRSDRVSKFNQLIRIEEDFDIKNTMKSNKFF